MSSGPQSCTLLRSRLPAQQQSSGHGICAKLYRRSAIDSGSMDFGFSGHDSNMRLNEGSSFEETLYQSSGKDSCSNRIFRSFDRPSDDLDAFVKHFWREREHLTLQIQFQIESVPRTRLKKRIQLLGSFIVFPGTVAPEHEMLCGHFWQTKYQRTEAIATLFDEFGNRNRQTQTCHLPRD